MSSPARMAAATAVAAALAACSPDDSPTAGPEPRPTSPGPIGTGPAGTDPPATADPTAGSTPAPTATAPPDQEQPDEAEAPFPADRRPDTAVHSGGRLSPIDLRFGVHDGYDRVVLDLAGDGSPGWRAEYVDEPRNQGRGDRADVAGEAHLEVMVHGMRYPTEPGAQPYRGPDEMTPGSAGVVVEVEKGPLYEGYQQLFVGLRSEQPFRVFRLDGPPRVVIDVQHPR